MSKNTKWTLFLLKESLLILSLWSQRVLRLHIPTHILGWIISHTPRGKWTLCSHTCQYTVRQGLHGQRLLRWTCIAILLVYSLNPRRIHQRLDLQLGVQSQTQRQFPQLTRYQLPKHLKLILVSVLRVLAQVLRQIGMITIAIVEVTLLLFYGDRIYCCEWGSQWRGDPDRRVEERRRRRRREDSKWRRGRLIQSEWCSRTRRRGIQYVRSWRPSRAPPFTRTLFLWRFSLAQILNNVAVIARCRYLQ